MTRAPPSPLDIETSISKAITVWTADVLTQKPFAATKRHLLARSLDAVRDGRPKEAKRLLRRFWALEAA
jgi:hypothetical protein